MKNIYLLLIFFCLTICSVSYAQNVIPIKRQGMETVFINYKGEEIFTIPMDHEVNLRIVLELFDSGVVKVRKNKSELYWINSKGEIVKEFGRKYRHIENVFNGFATADLRDRRKDGRDIVFLNNKGEIAFNGKHFFYANSFSDGLTAVKETKESPWICIDTTGKKVFEVKPPPGYEIDQVKSFTNGSSYLRVKKKISTYQYKTEKIIINTKGELLFNLTKTHPDLNVDKIIFTPNRYIIIDSYSDEHIHELYILDDKGTIVRSFSNISYGYHPSGWISILDNKNRDLTFLDKNIQEIDFPYAEPVKYARPNFIRKYPTYTITQRPVRTHVHSPKDLSHLLRTEMDVLEINDSVILLRERYNKRRHLVDHKGNTLWKEPIDWMTFEDLHDAFPYQKELTKAVLDTPYGLDRIYHPLEKIEELTVRWMRNQVPPDTIFHMKTLKSLTLLNIAKLQYVPSIIAELPLLEYFEVTNCKMYESGIEYVLENASSLKKAVLNKVSLDEEALDRIQKKRPNLVIEWTRPDGVKIDFNKTLGNGN